MAIKLQEFRRSLFTLSFGQGVFGDSLTLNMEIFSHSETSKTICGATPRHITEEMTLCLALFVRFIYLFIFCIVPCLHFLPR